MARRVHHRRHQRPGVLRGVPDDGDRERRHPPAVRDHHAVLRVPGVPRRVHPAWRRVLGRPVLERYGRYVLISRRELELSERLFARYGSPIIFVSPLMPVVRTFISLPAGLARMPLVRFTVYTFLGSYPFCYALAYIGFRLGEHWHSLEGWFRKFDL